MLGVVSRVQNSPPVNSCPGAPQASSTPPIQINRQFRPMALVNFFRRPDYTSEATQFIDQLKADKPTLEAEQRAGRALLWDKKLVPTEQADYLDGRVAQQAYVYGTDSHPNAK